MDSTAVRENKWDLCMGIGALTESGSLAFAVDTERGKYKLSGIISLTTSPKYPFAAQAAVNSRP